MKWTTFVSLLLLAACATAAPIEDDDKIVVDKDVFDDELAIYTAEHDIVSLFVPLNQLNFDDDSDDNGDDDVEASSVLFFALADVDDKGDRTDQGLYIYKNHNATKLLDHGRDASSDNGDNDVAYLAAKEGLYVYDSKKNEAVKYGTITDSIVQVAKVNGSDLIYILTEDHKVYKVTDEGKEKTKIDQADNAREIVIDFEGNLYFLSDKLEPYVISDDAAKKITGLPESSAFGKLIRPPFVMEEGVLYVSNKDVYMIYANGTSEISEFVLEAKPSAYAPDATLIQYYGYEKKIYEYNVLSLMTQGLSMMLKNFLETKKDEIQAIATRSRSDLRP